MIVLNESRIIIEGNKTEILLVGHWKSFNKKCSWIKDVFCEEIKSKFIENKYKIEYKQTTSRFYQTQYDDNLIISIV